MSANEEPNRLNGLYKEHWISLDELESAAKTGGSYVVKASDLLDLMKKCVELENKLEKLTAKK